MRKISILNVRDNSGKTHKISDVALSKIDANRNEHDVVLDILNMLPSGRWRIELQLSDKEIK